MSTESELGVNGIRALDNSLYYFITPQRSLYRVRFSDPGHVVGQPQLITEGSLADDFAITRNAAYLAGLRDNIITRVLHNGRTCAVAGNSNSTALMTATSAAFGRTVRDENILYVTTGGETPHPENKTDHRGGKVVAVTFATEV